MIREKPCRQVPRELHRERRNARRTGRSIRPCARNVSHQFFCNYRLAGTKEYFGPSVHLLVVRYFRKFARNTVLSRYRRFSFSEKHVSEVGSWSERTIWLPRCVTAWKRSSFTANDSGYSEPKQELFVYDQLIGVFITKFLNCFKNWSNTYAKLIQNKKVRKLMNPQYLRIWIDKQLNSFIKIYISNTCPFTPPSPPNIYLIWFANISLI